MRWLPNLLTLARLALTPVCVYHVLSGRPDLALPLTVVAGLTDAADGYIARRFGAETRFGAWLDPVADKLLLTSLYVSIGIVNAAPAWLVWLVVGRDILILAMAAAGLVFMRIRDFPPTVSGKISTVVQVVGMLVLLKAYAGSAIALQLQDFTIWTVGAVTAWSGLHYVWRATEMLRAADKKV